MADKLRVGWAYALPDGTRLVATRGINRSTPTLKGRDGAGRRIIVTPALDGRLFKGSGTPTPWTIADLQESAERQDGA